jgi:hypothetical protein
VILAGSRSLVASGTSDFGLPAVPMLVKPLSKHYLNMKYTAPIRQRPARRKFQLSGCRM